MCGVCGWGDWWGKGVGAAGVVIVDAKWSKTQQSTLITPCGDMWALMDGYSAL